MHSLSVEMTITSPSGGVYGLVLVIIAVVHVVSFMFHCSPFWFVSRLSWLVS